MRMQNLNLGNGRTITSFTVHYSLFLVWDIDIFLLWIINQWNPMQTIPKDMLPWHLKHLMRDWWILGIGNYMFSSYYHLTAFGNLTLHLFLIIFLLSTYPMTSATFCNMSVPSGEMLIDPGWTIPCRLSVAFCSKNSQLFSKSGGHLLFPLRQYAPCSADRNTHKSNLSPEGRS